MNLSRQEAAQQTHKKIIAAAFEIVGKSGYDALTTNSLITEAGVAKGTLYHHFDNLDDVVYSMIHTILDQALDDINTIEYLSINEYFEALGQFLITNFISDQRVWNVIYGFLPKGMNDPAVREIAVRILESACNRITPDIQHFYDGKLSEEKIDHATRMIDMFCTGFCFHYVIFADHTKYKIIWTEFTDMLIGFLENN